MANAKEMDKRIQKILEEKEKMANGFGKVVLDKLDVTTVTEFRKVISANAELINELIVDSRKSEEKKVQPAVDHSTEDNELEEDNNN